MLLGIASFLWGPDQNRNVVCERFARATLLQVSAYGYLVGMNLISFQM